MLSEDFYFIVLNVCLALTTAQKKTLDIALAITFVKTSWRAKGGLELKPKKKLNTYLSCHNFFFLSSVQILLIPACCLLCVL